jgi:Cft2 family RNA processing exonuclease
LNRNWGFTPSEVDYLILSHAHIDHSGLIPKLVKDGFKGKIFSTPATRELAGVLLEDSAGIQEDDIKYANKKRKALGQPFLKPLYTRDEALVAMDQFHVVDYGNWFKIEEGIELMYTDVGHIIGSAAVHLRINNNGKVEQLTFSGDVGRAEHGQRPPVHRVARRPYRRPHGAYRAFGHRRSGFAPGGTGWGGVPGPRGHHRHRAQRAADGAMDRT